MRLRHMCVKRKMVCFYHPFNVLEVATNSIIVAMNYTEIESKVREATNNEPWGAPTTLMAQIASATYNYREREEILAFIFRRFTEKAANEWRQIYKSLQLLDYLIKNGSERIIDDVRSNLSLIQMLKSFHYIDSKGRDQGINVRNRAKNLINLLNDDALIRSERKKARANQKKFGGVSSAAFGGASSIGTGYGGSSSTFTDVDDDEFTNRVYGDGGVYGERYDDPASAYQNGATGTGGDQFEEYDVQPTTKTAVSKATTRASRVNAGAATKSKPQPKEPEKDLLGDLLGLDDAPKQTTTSNAGDDDDDDDFDDFQAAPSQGQKQNNLSSNLTSLYHPQQQQQQQQQTQTIPQFQQFPSQQSVFSGNASTNTGSSSTGPAKSSNNDAFSSLFLSAKTKTGGHKTSGSQSKTATTPSSTSTPAPTTTSQNDDLFGDFNSNNQTKPTSNSNSNSNNGGDVDLLSF